MQQSRIRSTSYPSCHLNLDHLGAAVHFKPLCNKAILDEFGFRPGVDQDGYYSGNPEYAHYPLFEDVLNDFEPYRVCRRLFYLS
ncbi:hypothetical protein GPS58_13785 [Acinetobacter haemolyticus]|nr:hypothetical protein [Acinetobacter haemolyticus]